MEVAPCKNCANLNDSAIASLPSTTPNINYYSLQTSAKECQYCKIIVEGVEASGFRKDSVLYSRSSHPTFRLTPQYNLVGSGAEDILEFYVPDHKNSESEQKPESLVQYSSGDAAALSAVKPRPVVAPFWDESLRAQILAWMGEQRPMSLPKRVLDLGQGQEDLSHDVRLWETRGMTAAYVALSHCWINRTILTTTNATLADHFSSIPFNQLPPTYQESAQVCRWLGIRYLWIDSLCIIQDNAADWEEQAAEMGTIYENAFFTIAAHGKGADHHSLIPEPREHELSTHLPGVEEPIRVRRIAVHDFSLPWDEAPTSGDKPDVISARGWCFQERLLSSQVLHFTSSEVLHENQKGIISCQCGDEHDWNQPKVRRLQLQNSRDPARLWRDIVTRYSRRAFTYQWDILPGIAGIAQRFQQCYAPGQYLAGLWHHDLARWLCWQSIQMPLQSSWKSGCGQCGIWPKRLQEKPPRDDYILPSFSWASRSGACQFFDCVWHPSYAQAAKVREAHVQADQTNAYGRFLRFAVGIRGYILDMEILSTIDKNQQVVNGCLTAYAYLFPPGTLEVPAEPSFEWFRETAARGSAYSFDAVDDIPADCQQVQLLRMFVCKPKCICLVLKAETGAADQDDGKAPAFRRIGICDIDNRVFRAASEREIILV